MCKSNPKTMRFDTKIEQYIESFRGNNFSDKFHNLVSYFIDEEKNLSSRIERLKNQEEKLQNDISKLLEVKRSLENIDRYLKYAENVIQK